MVVSLGGKVLRLQQSPLSQGRRTFYTGIARVLSRTNLNLFRLQIFLSYPETFKSFCTLGTAYKISRHVDFRLSQKTRLNLSSSVMFLSIYFQI